jgi:hypothetical protein
VYNPAVHPPKPFDGKRDGVEHFLRRLKKYLMLCRIPEASMLDYATTFLEGQADKQWASESNVLGVLKGSPLTWSDFEHFLMTNFASHP